MDRAEVSKSVSEKSRSAAARSQFVAKVISLLEEALLKDLLCFTTACVMNYEEVQINMSYDEYYIVLGRKDKKQECRPYASDHIFRICNYRGEDSRWFEPFVLDESTNQDEFLCTLRDKLAGLHNRLMKEEAPSDVKKLSNQLCEQSRFLRHLQDSLSLTPLVTGNSALNKS